MPLDILHIDDALIAVNKPSGLPCLPLAGKTTEGTLAALLLARFPELASIPEFGIAHRLDNNTSGALIIGRTREAYEHLRTQFALHEVKKTYLALVMGHTPDEAEITAPIAHHPRKSHKMLVCTDPESAHRHKARMAYTSFCTVQHRWLRTKNDAIPYSLIEVRITTGVRHQIRAHLASIGFPIMGDDVYGKKNTQRLPGLCGHALHAWKVVVVHPVTSETVTITTNRSNFGSAV